MQIDAFLIYLNLRLDESSVHDLHKSTNKTNLIANDNLNVVDFKSNIKLNKTFNKVKANKVFFYYVVFDIGKKLNSNIKII